MSGRVGQQIGNYRLTHLLGRGGFAEVYLGEHIYLETQAAVKVLHAQVGSNELELFRQEARTIARLEHPHIVRVLEFGVDNDSPYLVMTYAPNGALRQRHPKGEQLPLKVILPYVEQVAKALQYIHDLKLIHRDVKPENLLVGSTNNILLSDFGIASVAHTTVSQISQGQAGTPHYMAPEQIMNKPSSASDQYALGVVVYEWLCGTRPFQGDIFNIFFQHLQTPPLALRERLSTISPLVEVVVLKALAKDPKQRFASVKAFATALEQASKAEQVTPSVVPGTLTAPSSTTHVTEAATKLGRLQQSAQIPQPAGQPSLSAGETVAGDQPLPQEQDVYAGSPPSVGIQQQRMQGRDFRQRQYKRRDRSPWSWIILAVILISLMSGGFRSFNGFDRGRGVIEPSLRDFKVNGQATIVITDTDGAMYLLDKVAAQINACFSQNSLPRWITSILRANRTSV
jgi:serine/threonine protein kinase